MVVVLVIALVCTVCAFVWLLNHLQARHERQLNHLLLHLRAPDAAVARDLSVPMDGPLYLPPEDDEAWNAKHRPGD
jgi:hypothetical protein